mmetsp:Transcript_17408/g.41272  ORF Transcript_17408/g.41272 Transcript_17408/m.41272 type:complete len:252 (-) Transcript_17408:184-939(-)
MAEHFSFTSELMDPSAESEASVSLMSCLLCWRSRSAEAFCSVFASSCFFPASISSVLAFTKPSWAFRSSVSCFWRFVSWPAKSSLRPESTPATPPEGAAWRKADLNFIGFFTSSSIFCRWDLVRRRSCLDKTLCSCVRAFNILPWGIWRNEDWLEPMTSRALSTEVADCVRSFSSAWNSATCFFRNSTAVSRATSFFATSSLAPAISVPRRELVAASSSTLDSSAFTWLLASSMLLAFSSPLVLHQHCIFS